MAMKPNSKFERMDPKPSATKRPGPASMPRPRMANEGGASSKFAMYDRREANRRASGSLLPKIAKAPEGATGGTVLPKLRPMVDTKVKARREAMRKAAQPMGKMK